MAGRKPIPSRLKVLKGTQKPSRVNHNEPQPALGRPVPLASLTPRALEHFYDNVEKLQQVGVLTIIDGAELSVYCQALADYEEANEKIAKHGKVYKSSNGNYLQNPYLTIRNKCFETIAKLGPNFGLNPSSRSRLHVNPPDETGNEWDEVAG